MSHKIRQTQQRSFKRSMKSQTHVTIHVTDIN